MPSEADPVEDLTYDAPVRDIDLGRSQLPCEADCLELHEALEVRNPKCVIVSSPIVSPKKNSPVR